VRGGSVQDEDHLAQMKGLRNLLGTAQVPQVDGVEGPPKEPYAPSCSFRKS
jgi:hypothetical protein